MRAMRMAAAVSQPCYAARWPWCAPALRQSLWRVLLPARASAAWRGKECAPARKAARRAAMRELRSTTSLRVQRSQCWRARSLQHAIAYAASKIYAPAMRDAPSDELRCRSDCLYIYAVDAPEAQRRERYICLISPCRERRSRTMRRAALL